MKVAIIGTGISGLGAAYLLRHAHDVTVYEKNDYPGGHARTVEASGVAVDTGFIVYNYRCYPNLCGLFKDLDVPVKLSNMSFGVSIDNGWLEYGTNGSLMRSIFAQKSNFFRPSYWRMLKDIFKFNKNARRYLDDLRDLSLGECVEEMGLGSWFKDYYLLAMGGAIWSCPLQTMLSYPAKTFIRFFENHGLLTVAGQPRWYTVDGGSREYVRRIMEKLKGRMRLNCGVQSVTREDGKVSIHDTQGVVETYDRVIFACHSDQALNLLDAPTHTERDILGAIRYQPNRVILHKDKSFMPRRTAAWSSWVYLSEKETGQDENICLSYWMNNLQSLETQDPLIVTLNPQRRPASDLIYDEHDFAHPVFDQGAIDAQARIQDIQGEHNTYYCGAWQRYGFHEDGLLSAVNVAKLFGVEIPWE